MSAKFRRYLKWAGVLISAVMTMSAFANTNERGLRIRHYELAQSIQQIPQDTAHSFTLRFEAYGRRFDLLLRPNARLMPVVSGNHIALYEGTLPGQPASWARVSISATATRGMFWDGKELYLVDSPSVLGANRAAALSASDTVIYRLADALSTPASSVAAPDYRSLLDEVERTPRPLDSVGYRLDVSALGDPVFRSRYASDQEAQDEILVRMNNVDGIFSAQLGVQIVVSLVDTRDAATAPLSDSTDASLLLRQLAGLRMQQPELNERAMTFLFTGRKLDAERVGLAYTASLCSPAYSAGLAQGSANSGLDSLIAAHEIAHILGAPHDGEKQCANTPRSRFLMTPALISSESVFSSCSIASMQPRIRGGSCVVALNDAGHPIERRFVSLPSSSAETEAATVSTADE